MAPPAPKPGQTAWSDPCSVCGAEVTGWSSETEMFSLFGGVVRQPDFGPSVPRSELIVPVHTYTVHPCGHTVPTIRIYTREPL